MAKNPLYKTNETIVKSDGRRKTYNIPLENFDCLYWKSVEPGDLIWGGEVADEENGVHRIGIGCYSTNRNQPIPGLPTSPPTENFKRNPWTSGIGNRLLELNNISNTFGPNSQEYQTYATENMHWDSDEDGQLFGDDDGDGSGCNGEGTGTCDESGYPGNGGNGTGGPPNLGNCMFNPPHPYYGSMGEDFTQYECQTQYCNYDGVISCTWMMTNPGDGGNDIWYSGSLACGSQWSLNPDGREPCNQVPTYFYNPDDPADTVVDEEGNEWPSFFGYEDPDDITSLKRLTHYEPNCRYPMLIGNGPFRPNKIGMYNQEYLEAGLIPTTFQGENSFYDFSEDYIVCECEDLEQLGGVGDVDQEDTWQLYCWNYLGPIMCSQADCDSMLEAHDPETILDQRFAPQNPGGEIKFDIAIDSNNIEVLLPCKAESPIKGDDWKLMYYFYPLASPNANGDSQQSGHWNYATNVGFYGDSSLGSDGGGQKLFNIEQGSSGGYMRPFEIQASPTPLGTVEVNGIEYPAYVKWSLTLDQNYDQLADGQKTWTIYYTCHNEWGRNEDELNPWAGGTNQSNPFFKRDPGRQWEWETGEGFEYTPQTVLLNSNHCIAANRDDLPYSVLYGQREDLYGCMSSDGNYDYNGDIFIPVYNNDWPVTPYEHTSNHNGWLPATGHDIKDYFRPIPDNVNLTAASIRSKYSEVDVNFGLADHEMIPANVESYDPYKGIDLRPENTDENICLYMEAKGLEIPLTDEDGNILYDDSGEPIKSSVDEFLPFEDYILGAYRNIANPPYSDQFDNESYQNAKNLFKCSTLNENYPLEKYHEWTMGGHINGRLMHNSEKPASFSTKNNIGEFPLQVDFPITELRAVCADGTRVTVASLVGAPKNYDGTNLDGVSDDFNNHGGLYSSWHQMSFPWDFRYLSGVEACKKLSGFESEAYKKSKLFMDSANKDKRVSLGLFAWYEENNLLNEFAGNIPEEYGNFEQYDRENLVGNGAGKNIAYSGNFDFECRDGTAWYITHDNGNKHYCDQWIDAEGYSTIDGRSPSFDSEAFQPEFYNKEGEFLQACTDNGGVDTHQRSGSTMLTPLGHSIAPHIKPDPRIACTAHGGGIWLEDHVWPMVKGQENMIPFWSESLELSNDEHSYTWDNSRTSNYAYLMGTGTPTPWARISSGNYLEGSPELDGGNYDFYSDDGDGWTDTGKDIESKSHPYFIPAGNFPGLYGGWNYAQWIGWKTYSNNEIIYEDGTTKGQYNKGWRFDQCFRSDSPLREFFDYDTDCEIEFDNEEKPNGRYKGFYQHIGWDSYPENNRGPLFMSPSGFYNRGADSIVNQLQFGAFPHAWGGFDIDEHTSLAGQTTWDNVVDAFNATNAYMMYEPGEWARWVFWEGCHSNDRCLQMNAHPTEFNVRGAYRRLNQWTTLLPGESPRQNLRKIIPMTTFKVSWWQLTAELYPRADKKPEFPEIEVAITRGGNPSHPPHRYSPGSDKYNDHRNPWYQAAAYRGKNTVLGKWEKFEFEFQMNTSFLHSDDSTDIKNLYLNVNWHGGGLTNPNAWGNVYLDDFEVFESFDFKPDVDIRSITGPDKTSDGILTEYYDEELDPQKYKDNKAPVEAQFYFYPRFPTQNFFYPWSDGEMSLVEGGREDIGGGYYQTEPSPIYNDFRRGRFYLYDIDWGDGSKNEYAKEPLQLGDNVSVNHTYDRSGVFEISAYMLRVKPSTTQDVDPTSVSLGVVSHKRIFMRINVNPGDDEDFTYFGSEGYSYIPYTNTIPVIGGVSKDSSYYKTLYRQLGFIEADDEDIKVDISFSNDSDKLKVEQAVVKMNDKLLPEMTLTDEYRKPRFINPDDQNQYMFSDDWEGVFNYAGALDNPEDLATYGIKPIEGELGKSIGDVDISTPRYFNRPMTMSDMLGMPCQETVVETIENIIQNSSFETEYNEEPTLDKWHINKACAAWDIRLYQPATWSDELDRNGDGILDNLDTIEWLPEAGQIAPNIANASAIAPMIMGNQPTPPDMPNVVSSILTDYPPNFRDYPQEWDEGTWWDDNVYPYGYSPSNIYGIPFPIYMEELQIVSQGYNDLSGQDVTAWATFGRPDIAQYVAKIIMGDEDFPPYITDPHPYGYGIPNPVNKFFTRNDDPIKVGKSSIGNFSRVIFTNYNSSHYNSISKLGLSDSEYVTLVPGETYTFTIRYKMQYSEYPEGNTAGIRFYQHPDNTDNGTTWSSKRGFTFADTDGEFVVESMTFTADEAEEILRIYNSYGYCFHRCSENDVLCATSNNCPSDHHDNYQNKEWWNSPYNNTVPLPWRNASGDYAGATKLSCEQVGDIVRISCSSGMGCRHEYNNFGMNYEIPKILEVDWVMLQSGEEFTEWVDYNEPVYEEECLRFDSENPSLPVYWKNIIPKDHSIYARHGLNKNVKTTIKKPGWHMIQFYGLPNSGVDFDVLFPNWDEMASVGWVQSNVNHLSPQHCNGETVCENITNSGICMALHNFNTNAGPDYGLPLDPDGVSGWTERYPCQWVTTGADTEDTFEGHCMVAENAPEGGEILDCGTWFTYDNFANAYGNIYTSECFPGCDLDNPHWSHANGGTLYNSNQYCNPTSDQDSFYENCFLDPEANIYQFHVSSLAVDNVSFESVHRIWWCTQLTWAECENICEPWDMMCMIDCSAPNCNDYLEEQESEEIPGEPITVNRNFEQSWIGSNKYLNNYYYPVLPHWTRFGYFEEGRYPYNQTPMPLDGAITDINYKSRYLQIAVADELDYNIYSDDSGNQNFGFSFSDYKPEFDDETLTPKLNQSLTPIEKGEKDRGAF